MLENRNFCSPSTPTPCMWGVFLNLRLNLSAVKLHCGWCRQEEEGVSGTSDDATCYLFSDLMISHLSRAQLPEMQFSKIVLICSTSIFTCRWAHLMAPFINPLRSPPLCVHHYLALFLTLGCESLVLCSFSYSRCFFSGIVTLEVLECCTGSWEQEAQSEAVNAAWLSHQCSKQTVFLSFIWIRP